MNINRNNYEEYFLLYVDGELTTAEKNAVDAFIKQQPDLEAELLALQQTILPQEQISFSVKDALLKNELTAINSANYEEQFLLYVDNELNAVEKEEVNKFVLQHPQYQQVFTALQQTRLYPEQVLHPDKTSLYKKEERRVVYLSFKKLAIAAILIGMVILVWTIRPAVHNDFTNPQGISGPVTANKDRDILKGSVLQPPASSRQTESNIYSNNKEITPIAAKEIRKEKSSRNNHSPVDVASLNNLNPGQSEPVSATPQQALQKNDALVAATDAPVKTVQTAAGNSKTVQAATIAAHEDHQQQTLTKQTVYKEIDTNDDDDNTLYIGNLELNKNRVKGLLKKAGRIFAKPKNNEEASMAIASFPISHSK
ncbi:MAG: hypothetical protein J0I09_09535 [Sphingobacteriia bacterium]|nr:hypothetical protein [Sphingobacteriia bacterium]